MAADRCDNRLMFEQPGDRIAALLALAAIALALVAAGGLWAYGWLFVAGAVAMLVVGVWWLSRQAPGTPFRELALPVSVATVMPIFGGLMSTAAFGDPLAALPWILVGAANGVVGAGLADRLPDRYRLSGLVAALGLAAAGAGLGVISGTIGDPSGSQVLLALVGVLAIAASTAAPGIVAGAVWRAASEGAGRSVVSALELGVIGLTPAIAVLTLWGGWPALLSPRTLVPLLLWIGFVLAAQSLAVRPLARTATVATTQRDLVVAAMEAERSRIAADIHDDALQELTLLAWQLDSSGQGEGARAAREIAERLRAICGDLRLPILDDLGTGPALEWLVERVGRLAGGEVRLERSDQVRPPADVELAFFRVAQEALSNAVRHGRPPIIVRYWTSPSGASLSIDDAGSGFDPVRIEVGEGHFGLLNMRQRAEQVGALLDIRRWPAGGTQVALEWRAS